MSMPDMCICGHSIDDHEISEAQPCTIEDCDCSEFDLDDSPDEAA
jgi:hypothetical protein